MNKERQKGFTLVEGLLLLVVAGLVGFTAWYVWNSKNKTDNSYSSASNSSAPKRTSIKTFEDCKKSPGSRLLQSYPGVCVTADGHSFPDTDEKAPTYP